MHASAGTEAVQHPLDLETGEVMGQVIVGVFALGIAGTVVVTLLGWLAAGVSALFGRRH